MRSSSSNHRPLRDRLEHDNRVDPRLKQALIDYIHIFGGVGFLAKPQHTSFASREDIIQDFNAELPGYIAGLAGKPTPEIPNETRLLWTKSGLDISTRTITSFPDGNPIKLSIMRPNDRSSGLLPCVVYLHGGAMAFNSAFDPQYQVVGRMLAHQGVVSVLVDFRNSIQATASNPEVAAFPAGLNDCYSALAWVNENAQALRVNPGQIALAGESGGGNLTIATALKCKQEGMLRYISSGFYAICPYIAGSWPEDVVDRDGLGRSHLYEENNGIFLHLGGMMNEATAYGREAFERKDPLAWPSFASVEELKGLPKCVIVVNEVGVSCRKVV